MASIRKTKKRKKRIEKALRAYFHAVLYPASTEFARKLSQVLKTFPEPPVGEGQIKFVEYPIV